jgi:peptidoglycan-N-acetylglucosamine deacetylase
VIRDRDQLAGVLVDTDLVRKWVIGASIALVVLLVAVFTGYTLSKSRNFQLTGEIGNHTYTHRRMMFVSGETVANEIERTDEAITRTGYRGPVTFRPPYGKKLWALPHYLAEHGRTTITWDLEPDSAGNPTTNQIVQEIVENARPGSIILLHVMLESRAASRAAVPQIIDRLQSDGYRFVTVSELLALRTVGAPAA